MAQRFHLTGWDALIRGIGNLSLERVDEAGRLTGYGLVSVLARAATIFLGTVIIGGIILSAANAFVAGLFGVPEFGEMRSMGFTMAGVLGLCLAVWFLVRSLRNSAEMD
jgi:hypothetical protein